MNLGEVRARLLAADMPGSTPVALVESGTTERQRSIVTTLAQLVLAARRHRVGTPAVVIIGRVAKLAAELAWFTPEGAVRAGPLLDGAGAHG